MTVGLDGLLGVGSGAVSIVAQQQQKAQGRDDQKENTARWAINVFTFSTTGAGTLIGGTVAFDCSYIQEPVFTSGLVLRNPPDLLLYHMPLANVGVYAWHKEPQLPAATTNAAGDPVSTPGPTSVDEPDDGQPMYYTGADLYFEVQIKPLETADPRVIAAAPAYPELVYHLCFNGSAMKKLSPSISDSKNDITVPSRDAAVLLG